MYQEPSFRRSDGKYCSTPKVANKVESCLLCKICVLAEMATLQLRTDDEGGYLKKKKKKNCVVVKILCHGINNSPFQNIDVSGPSGQKHSLQQSRQD